MDADADGGDDHRRPQSPPTASAPAAASGMTPARSTVTPAGYSSSTGSWPSPYPRSAAGSPLPPGVASSPASSTPRRFFRRPPSPAKHIKASLAKRFGRPKPSEGPIPEDGGGGGGGGGVVVGQAEGERLLDKSFGYEKNFRAKYEVGKEVGKGHFGHTCLAIAKKGELKGQLVAVKIISKAKVRWYVKGGVLPPSLSIFCMITLILGNVLKTSVAFAIIHNLYCILILINYLFVVDSGSCFQELMESTLLQSLFIEMTFVYFAFLLRWFFAMMISVHDFIINLERTYYLLYCDAIIVSVCWLWEDIRGSEWVLILLCRLLHILNFDIAWFCICLHRECSYTLNLMHSIAVEFFH